MKTVLPSIVRERHQTYLTPSIYSGGGIILNSALRWRKEWICSEWPITISAIVKSWTHARSHWSNISVVTREQGPIRALISFAYKRNLIASINWECAEHKFWATSWHWLRLACWGWPVGFISTCVWSSKLSLRTRLLRLVKTPACTRQNYGGRQGVTHSFWQFFAHV